MRVHVWKTLTCIYIQFAGTCSYTYTYTHRRYLCISVHVWNAFMSRCTQLTDICTYTYIYSHRAGCELRLIHVHILAQSWMWATAPRRWCKRSFGHGRGMHEWILAHGWLAGSMHGTLMYFSVRSCVCVCVCVSTFAKWTVIKWVDNMYVCVCMYVCMYVLAHYEYWIILILIAVRVCVLMCSYIFTCITYSTLNLKKKHAFLTQTYIHTY